MGGMRYKNEDFYGVSQFSRQLKILQIHIPAKKNSANSLSHQENPANSFSCQKNPAMHFLAYLFSRQAYSRQWEYAPV